MKELWMTIPFKKGWYEASSLGRIRAKSRTVSLFNWASGRMVYRTSKQIIIKQRLDKDGYLGTSVGSAHRLVALAFIPNPEGKSQINHKNGVKTDNRPENLEWVTCKENIHHAVANGTHANMRGNKIQPRDIPKILRRLAAGEARAKIAHEFGVTVGTIIDIRSGKTWKRIVQKWVKDHGEIPRKTWKKLEQR